MSYGSLDILKSPRVCHVLKRFHAKRSNDSENQNQIKKIQNYNFSRFGTFYREYLLSEYFPEPLLGPHVHIARWAHMHRFLSICPSLCPSLDNNSYLGK